MMKVCIARLWMVFSANETHAIILSLQVIKKVRAIRREIKKVNPDILYCHSSFAGGLGRMAAIGLHRKVVYNPHGWAFNMSSKF